MHPGILGRTGLEVTELGFGALPFGPLQKNLGTEEAADVLALALEKGVTFVDGAKGYRTHGAIRLAMERTGRRPVISTKSGERTYGEMEASIQQALAELGVDCIDIYLLHGVKAGENGLAARKGAFDCLQDCQARGRLKAIGVSTHSAKVTALMAAEPGVDVVFPIINRIGRGIRDGSLAEMEAAITACHDNGKGVYLMKVLGGGTLIDDYIASIEYARSLPGFMPLVLGMVSRDEVEFNVDYFNGLLDRARLPSFSGYRKQVYIARGVCTGCQVCAKACHSGAIDYDDAGKGRIDRSKCVLCCYCIPECPSFAIRVI